MSPFTGKLGSFIKREEVLTFMLDGEVTFRKFGLPLPHSSTPNNHAKFCTSSVGPGITHYKKEERNPQITPANYQLRWYI